MQSGWIKLHRQIQDCCLWTAKEPFDRRSAWVDLLMDVNSDDKQILVNGVPLMVHRGQKYTSIRNLSSKWGWSNGKTLRYLNTLKMANMISVDGTPNGTLITVENYDKFQGERNTERNTDGYTVGTQTEHRRYTNKNIRIEKKERIKEKGASPRFDEEGNELF